MTERKIRRMQALSPFGVGAIIDILGESFVAEDVSRWQGKREPLPAPRIAAHFGVPELRMPPAAGNGPGLPYYRFPQWLFCNACRTMVRWSTRKERAGRAPRCEACRRAPQLVPMRFVAVCGNGHLEDVPWDRWAHSSAAGRDQRQCGRPVLRFEHVANVGGGLESLRVRCTTCRGTRDLRDITSPTALSRIGVRCHGKQPWQYDQQAENCDERPAVLQRGASSVYFPDTASAIDLPPESDWVAWGGPTALIEQCPEFGLLHANPNHPIRAQLIDMIATAVDVTTAQVEQVLASRLGEVSVPDAGAAEDLAEREWQALTDPPAEYHALDRFIARRTPFPSPGGHRALQGMADSLAERVCGVTLVDRLREVRVLRGFRRHTMNRLVRADLAASAGFLPAVEIYGEGIFLRFDEGALQQWEAQDVVQQRCETLRKRLAASPQARWLELEPTPRLLLLHSFSHLLLRQLAFDAGYSSSSLRERLYSSPPGARTTMAGLLIYTAAGDAEGTLGGLARAGQAERLTTTIAAALAAAQWCSLDPVCREASAQGPAGLSMAACHACMLVSETSCTVGNLLLDRTLIVDETYGYFRGPLADLVTAQANG
ncbi:DUF1998 domain-containing protein [Micromonospora chersina]|uniref:DUF1998 domain-containing protein n=1 Tax=Micromonospora chersina TaxID=47854 RepID=UPI0033DE3345